MNLAVKIARRYLFSKKSTNAINIISVVSMIAMAVGTMALIIVLSVFNGFESLVLGLYNSFHPDIQVSVKEGKTFVIESSKAQQLQNIEGIAHVSSVLEENAFLKYGNNSYIATIKGVDEFYTQVSGVDSTLVWGKFILNGSNGYSGEKNINYAVLGAGVEAALAVNLENPFKSIQVHVPKRTKRGFLLPKDAFNKLPIYPAGIFSIQQDLDNEYVIVPLNFMRQLLDYQKEISALEIGLQPSADIEKVKRSIQKILGTGFEIENRYEQNKFLHKIMQAEKWAVYLILTFILIIAAFNIIGSLSMLVIEKKKDIGILKAMGATGGFVRRVFLLQGLMMSVIGAGVGMGFALILLAIQQIFGIIELQGRGTFVIDAYPVEMKLTDFVLVFITVIIIGLLASWFPSKRTTQQRYIFSQV